MSSAHDERQTIPPIRIWVFVGISALVVIVLAVFAVNRFAQGALDPTMQRVLSDVLASHNATALSERGTFSDPVDIVDVHSDYSMQGPETPDQAVMTLERMLDSNGSTHWNLALTSARLSEYRAGHYGACFPADAVVARSDEGSVISFVGHGTTVDKVCFAQSKDLLG